MQQDVPASFLPGKMRGWNFEREFFEDVPEFENESQVKSAFKSRMKAFKDKGWLTNDVLKVHVSLKAFVGPPQRLSSAAACKHDGVAGLASDIGQLMDDVEAADVSLICKDGTLKAHRPVLVARSPVLRAMFTAQMQERANGEIALSDVSRDTVHQLLHFIYRGMLPDDLQDADIWALLPLAHRYEVASLVAACSGHLAAKLSIQNVAAVLAEADMLNMACLKDVVLSFMLRDTATFEEVQATAAYTALPSRLLQEAMARAMGSRKRARPAEASEAPDDTPWHALTVARLKVALAERGLSTAGSKNQMVARLTEASAAA